ncbi:MAG: acetylxylan esterase [Planctomycetota bacterium]
MPANQIRNYYNTAAQLRDRLLRRTYEALDKGDAARSGIRTKQEHCRRVEWIRQELLKNIGGLPHTDAPLKAEITGTIDCGDFRIEKVLYQSLPEFYVTANLYVPNTLKKAAPAILFPCGHTENGKAYEPYQKACRDFVLHGFVVFCPDPVGQGERLGYWNKEKGCTDVAWGTYEHSYNNFKATLVGANVARYFINDAMRGIDFLQSLDYVDSEHIGVTGNSGGGTQTAYMMVLDERVKAAAPATFIHGYRWYAKSGVANDGEQDIYNFTGCGLDHSDFLIAFAPKPMMVLAVNYDFFPIEGTINSVAQARHIYEIYGKSENLALVRDDNTHDYTAMHRKEAVLWFQKHLMGLSEPVYIQHGIDVLPDEQLQVTRSGQVLGDFPEVQTVHALCAELYEQKKDKSDMLSFIKEIVFSYREPVDFLPRFIERQERDECTIEMVFFHSEVDVFLSAALLLPNDVKNPSLILWIEEDITTRLDEIYPSFFELLKEGQAILAVDIRGSGSVLFNSINPNDVKLRTHKGTESIFAQQAIRLGDSLFAQRVYDVVRAAQFARTLKSVDAGNLTLVGRGVYSLYAVYASVLIEPCVSAYDFGDSISNPSEWVEKRLFDWDEIGDRMLHWELALRTDVEEILRYLRK